MDPILTLILVVIIVGGIFVAREHSGAAMERYYRKRKQREAMERIEREQQN